MAKAQRILSFFVAAFLAAFVLTACVDTPPGGFDSQKLNRCTSDDDCHGGICASDGRCVGGNDGNNNGRADEDNDCRRNSDCGDNEVCLDGRCVDNDGIDECDNDNDCDSGEECDDGRCVDEDNNRGTTDQTEEPRDTDFGVDENKAKLVVHFVSETGVNVGKIEMNGDFVSHCPDDNGFMDDVAGGWTEPIDTVTNTSDFTFYARVPVGAKFFRGSFTLIEDGEVAGWSCTGYRTRIGRGELTAEYEGDDASVSIVSVRWKNADGSEEAGCGFVVELGNACRDSFPEEVDLTEYTE